ncbi:hypothetical protein ACLOJK_027680 [Asimina triloba]
MSKERTHEALSSGYVRRGSVDPRLRDNSSTSDFGQTYALQSVPSKLGRPVSILRKGVGIASIKYLEDSLAISWFEEWLSYRVDQTFRSMLMVWKAAEEYQSLGGCRNAKLVKNRWCGANSSIREINIPVNWQRLLDRILPAEHASKGQEAAFKCLTDFFRAQKAREKERGVDSPSEEQEKKKRKRRLVKAARDKQEEERVLQQVKAMLLKT